jgi:hypothetical protein
MLKLVDDSENGADLHRMIKILTHSFKFRVKLDILTSIFNTALTWRGGVCGSDDVTGVVGGGGTLR